MQDLNTADLSARAGERYVAGDFDGALADYSKALEFDPRNETAWCNRGKTRHVMGDLDGAIADYSQAIELDPKDAYALLNRGVALHTRQDLDLAINDFSSAIELDPKNAATYIHRGVARHAVSDFAGAIDDYTMAIELDPENSTASFNRGLARKARGDLHGAMADYARAVELDPKDTDARTSLANARRQAGIFCEACTNVSSTAYFPGKVSSLNGIGRMFYGEESRCPTCGSCVRTLWFTLLFLPIVPLGSYRIINGTFERGVASTTERFHARRTDFCWKQVVFTWFAGLAVVLGSIAALVYLVIR